MKILFWQYLLVLLCVILSSCDNTQVFNQWLKNQEINFINVELDTQNNLIVKKEIQVGSRKIENKITKLNTATFKRTEKQF